MTTTDHDSDRRRNVRPCLPASGSPSPAAHPGWAWPSSASSLNRGAHVAFVARRRERVAQFTAEHVHAHGIVGDVSKKEDIHPLALQILGALGGLDVLINNASDLGPVPLALLADTECEDFERALATNVLGPFRLTKALLGSLAASAREGSGAVVLNVSSDAGIHSYPRWGAYGASKAALHHLSRTWHEELATTGIAVESIDPGDMDTPMHAAALPEADRTSAQAPGGRGARARRRDRPRADVAARGGARARDGGGAVISASRPTQRPAGAKLLVADRRGRLEHWARGEFVRLFTPWRRGDRQRRRHVAREPVRTSPANRRSHRSASRGPRRRSPSIRSRVSRPCSSALATSA